MSDDFYDTHGFRWHGPEPPMHVPARSWEKNPYEHTYRLDGTGKCDAACDACAWNRARVTRQREDFGLREPLPITPTDKDMKFLADLRVSWYGDKR